MLTTFKVMQEKSEEQLKAWKEERWRKETELEEKRRREERAHELQVLQLLTRGHNTKAAHVLIWTPY